MLLLLLYVCACVCKYLSECGCVWLCVVVYVSMLMCACACVCACLCVYAWHVRVCQCHQNTSCQVWGTRCVLNSKHIRFKSNASRCVCADVPVRSRNTVGSNFLIPVGLARTNSQNNTKSTDAVLLGCFWNIDDCCLYKHISIPAKTQKHQALKSTWIWVYINPHAILHFRLLLLVVYTFASEEKLGAGRFRSSSSTRQSTRLFIYSECPIATCRILIILKMVHTCQQAISIKSLWRFSSSNAHCIHQSYVRRSETKTSPRNMYDYFEWVFLRHVFLITRTNRVCVVSNCVDH